MKKILLLAVCAVGVMIGCKNKNSVIVNAGFFSCIDNKFDALIDEFLEGIVFVGTPSNSMTCMVET